jgi:hypothetical protein
MLVGAAIVLAVIGGAMSNDSVQQILLALAGNSALLPEHVDAVIAAGDAAVLRELAREQHLTLAQTARLAGYGQREIVLALIESGNMPVERIPAADPWAMLAAIGRADAPAAWWPLLASWPDVTVRRTLGEYAAERVDVAQLVAGDQDCSVAACAAGLWELPDDLAVRLARRTQACIRVALASNHRAPGPILADLIDNGGQPPMNPCPHWPDAATVLREIRRLAAGNPNTPREAVAPFTAQPDAALALALAGRVDLPDEIYDNLVALQDKDVTVRIAMNWAAPADLLRRLYDSEAGRWRQAVLANPRTPLDLLVRHSRAGGTPSTDKHPGLDGLYALATDTDPRVRLVAAASHRLPPDVRDALIDDADFDVAVRAVCHVSVSGQQIRATATRHGPRVFPALAAHPCCPPDVLLTIATHPQSPAGAIVDVAIHEASPPAALDACMQHPHAIAYVACNPSAEPETLNELAGHADPEVVLEVARNRSMPRAAGHRILQRLATPTIANPQQGIGHEGGDDRPQNAGLRA